METPISARFVLNGGDFAAAARAHQRTRPSTRVRFVRGLIYLMLIVFTLLVIAGSIRRARMGRRGDLPSVFPGLILMGCGWVVILLGPRVRRWQASRKVRQFTEAQRTQPWSFDDGGMSLQTPQAAASFRWDYFRRVVEARDLFLIYPTDKGYQVVPTRGFASGEVMGRFADLASRHVEDYVVSERCRHPSKPDPTGLGDY